MFAPHPDPRPDKIQRSDTLLETVVWVRLQIAASRVYRGPSPAHDRPGRINYGALALTPGTRLGAYEIVAALGAGGMGEVYRARDGKLDRDVAIKVLPPSVATDRDTLARFEREAKAVAALSHQHILAIHDFGHEDGIAYAVMELLEGEKILDFGLAKRVETGAPGNEMAPTRSGHTEPGTIMGTAGYMSAEQVKGLPVDHRSDIFSFGTILYELLSGRRAFRRDTNVETMAAIMRDEPTELSESGRNISPALDRIVRHCLEKDRDHRFQSARDIAFSLLEQSSVLRARRRAGDHRAGQCSGILDRRAAVHEFR